MNPPAARLLKADRTQVKCSRAKGKCKAVFGTLAVDDGRAHIELVGEGGWVWDQDRYGPLVRLSANAQRKYDAGRTLRSRRDFTGGRWTQKGHEPVTVFEIYEPTRVRCPLCAGDVILDPASLVGEYQTRLASQQRIE